MTHNLKRETEIMAAEDRRRKNSTDPPFTAQNKPVMDFDDELWNSIEGIAQAHSSPNETKMYSGFDGKNLHHQQQNMQHYSGGKQQFMSGKMQVEEDQYSDVSETLSPFNQFDNYDKDFFGYSNVFGYGNQTDEGFDEGHSQVETCRATYQAHYQNLVHHESIVPPVIKQIVDGAKAQVSTLLSAAEDDILSLDIDECAKLRIQQVFELCRRVAEPNEANQKTLESRILSFNAEHLKMEIAQEQQRIMASLESEPATPRSVRSEQRHKSEGRLHQVKKNSLKSSNSDASSFDPSNLFGDLDIKEVFMRSVDGQSLWAQMEQNKTVKNFFGHKALTTQTDEQNKEMIARTKLFVRILGYTLMEVEKRICRLISAAERREFMDIVVAAVPYPIHLETFANSTSKGLLDMFIRNKRHYQARKYGISLSSAPKAKK